MKVEEYRNHVKTKINEAIACKTGGKEEEEEECESCGLSVASGLLLKYCGDEETKDKLLNTFLEGDMDLNSLVGKIGENNIPQDILKWLKQTVPFDKTLAETDD